MSVPEELNALSCFVNELIRTVLKGLSLYVKLYEPIKHLKTCSLILFGGGEKC